jgi:hypothetical protein
VNGQKFFFFCDFLIFCCLLLTFTAECRIIICSRQQTAKRRTALLSYCLRQTIRYRGTAEIGYSRSSTVPYPSSCGVQCTRPEPSVADRSSYFKSLDGLVDSDPATGVSNAISRLRCHSGGEPCEPVSRHRSTADLARRSPRLNLIAGYLGSRSTQAGFGRVATFRRTARRRRPGRRRGVRAPRRPRVVCRRRLAVSRERPTERSVDLGVAA